MSQLPLEEAVARFRENEERIDTFVNTATPGSSYTTTGGQQVETLGSLIARLEAMAGGANSETAEVDFLNSGSLKEVVIPATWVTPTTDIRVQVTPNLLDHDYEDVLLEQIQTQVGDIIDGVGVTIFVYAPKTTWGKYNITIRG